MALVCLAGLVGVVASRGEKPASAHSVVSAEKPKDLAKQPQVPAAPEKLSPLKTLDAWQVPKSCESTSVASHAVVVDHVRRPLHAVVASGEGLAWYERAATALTTSRTLEKALLSLARRPSAPLSLEVRKALGDQETSGPLSAFREGASTADFAPKKISQRLGSCALFLGRLALAQGRAELERGSPALACAWATDTARFGQDLLRTGFEGEALIGAVIVNEATRALDSWLQPELWKDMPREKALETSKLIEVLVEGAPEAPNGMDVRFLDNAQIRLGELVQVAAKLGVQGREERAP